MRFFVCSSSVPKKGQEMTTMKNNGCLRAENGRYQRSSNGGKLCLVHLMNGSREQMAKDEMYGVAENAGNKVLFQNGEYCIVSEAVYRAVKQPEWREAKRKARNKKAVEDSYDKSKKKAPSRMAEIAVGDYYDSMQKKAGYTEGPEDILCKKEMLADLYAALDTLSDRDKEIMRLVSYKYTDAAIGERIGMSQRGVNKRKRVLLAKLKEILEKLL